MTPIANIPVSMIGHWGGPVLVGEAVIEDTQNMRVKFANHELVSEFYDLSEQELIVTISFQYTDKQPLQRPTTNVFEDGT